MTKTKNQMLILVGILFLSLPSLNSFGKKLETIDSIKIKKNGSSLFIEHILFWPNNKIIQDKSISASQIPEDIDRLKNLLNQILEKNYCPTDKTVDEKSIAIEECNGPNDYIFLGYYLKEDILIQVQDFGKALLVSEFPQENIPFQRNIGGFVEKKAKKLLKIGKDEWEKQPHLFISPLDIGESKFGNITFDPNYPFSDLWYAQIKWWSDGKNISFLVNTSTFEPDWSKEKLEKKAGKDMKPSPRKFRKRK